MVLGQHLRFENSDPVLDRGLGEVSDQSRPQAATLELVGDLQGHLCPAGSDRGVKAMPDHALGRAVQRYQAVALPIVDLDEAIDYPADLLDRTEEAHDPGLLRQPSQEVPEYGAVLGTHRPDMNGRAVAQDGVDVKVRGIPDYRQGR